METKHILSIDQFSKKDIENIFSIAKKYKKGVEKGKVYQTLKGKIATALFYEPSSRTFGSFIAAMQRLGGGIIPIQGVTYSSVSKGETLEDTIRTFGSYSDCIILRHSEEGAALRASEVSPIPIVNAGDGVGEHPTQALLDLFTILGHFNRTSNLTVAMVGDLKYGRTVHSLSKALSLYKGNTFYFVSPSLSPMPDKIIKVLKERKSIIYFVQTLEEIISKIDVLYMTRVQKERMDPILYDKIKNEFILNNRLADTMKKCAIIMHPLPRIIEIEKEVDSNPRAVYLTQQMRNGMYIRMALLQLVIQSNPKG